MNRNELLTLRMLGDNITLTRWQWEALLEELAADSELAGRISRMLS